MRTGQRCLLILTLMRRIITPTKAIIILFLTIIIPKSKSFHESLKLHNREFIKFYFFVFLCVFLLDTFYKQVNVIFE